MRKIVKWMMVVASLQFSVSYQCHAKDLGKFGATFPIQEVNFLEWFQEKLATLYQSGELDSHQKTITDTIKQRIMNPKPVAGLHRAVITRLFTIDPTVTLTQDILDHKGMVIIPKGTAINPLTKVNLSKPLVFFNADDPLQKAWVKKHFPQSKPILVAGKPLDLAEEWQMDIFFDQGGVLVKKLKIKALPAVVEQKGNFLQVKEVNVIGAT